MSQYDPRISAYFGDAVLQAGFMPVPHLMLRHYRQLQMSHTHLVFVLQLMEIAWDIRKPPVTVAQLAGRMEVTNRAIRKWSQELMDSGLIRIYDQYDTRGTQVENAYDLSPMFRRLAELAPVMMPQGEQRQRRARQGKHNIDTPSADDQAISSAGNDQDHVSGPSRNGGSSSTRNGGSSSTRNGGSSSTRNDGSPSSGTVVPPSPEPTFSETGNGGSGLKQEVKTYVKKQSKTTKEQQQCSEVDIPAAAVFEEFLSSSTSVESVGRSLRWGDPLSEEEVLQSRDVLLRIGLNAPVAHAVSYSLHPGEAWALCCYAKGATLGPAWVAKQVFDAKRRLPLLVAQVRGFDVAGRHLAALDPNLAEVIIETLIPGGGQSSSDLTADPRLAAALVGIEGDHIQATIACLTEAFAEQNGGRNRRCAHGNDPLSSVTPQLSLIADTPDPRWTQACTELARVVARNDWELWLQPLVPLDISAGHLVVGAPNVFVRDEVRGRFFPELEQAVCSAWGQDMAIDLAIDSPVVA